MKRFSVMSGMLLGVALIVGCSGSTKEIKPDGNKTPKVDQAEINKKIQEGMKMGGGAPGKQNEFKPK